MQGSVECRQHLPVWNNTHQMQINRQVFYMTIPNPANFLLIRINVFDNLFFLDIFTNCNGDPTDFWKRTSLFEFKLPFEECFIVIWLCKGKYFLQKLWHYGAKHLLFTFKKKIINDFKNLYKTTHYFNILLILSCF